MRNLIYAINTTLDGCVDHTKFLPDEDTFEHATQLVRGAGTLLYGGKTYELMVPYWPDAAKNPARDNNAHVAFARAFDAVGQMVVCSRTLDSPRDDKTKIVRTGLYEEIQALKQQPGKYILTGGVDIPTQLAALGLIDEYYFIVHPIVVGEGKRLFEGIRLQEKLQLKLADTTVFKSGSMVLHYLK